CASLRFGLLRFRFASPELTSFHSVGAFGALGLRALRALGGQVRCASLPWPSGFASRPWPR
ncbi:hypothetical protein ACIA98_43320, partial [Streptomyces sp. NPDC051366]|uniref:hypothetical protein n=1 Tax=Streptomyces sp. NPDC051366 TaxID=3365652 RepID=UPI0037BB721D